MCLLYLKIQVVESYFISQMAYHRNLQMINLESAALLNKAQWVWLETVKIHRRAPETRLSSSLSALGIFVALYYGGILHFNPKKPLDDQRDRCIISKGHGSICMYPILA